MERLLSLLALLPLGFTLLRGDEPPVTFRTSVQEVSLDLVVRDSKGHIAKNLKPEEVEIYEDGVRQQIKSFRLVTGRELETEKDAKAGRKAVFVDPSAKTNPLPAVNLICIVFHNLYPDPTLMKNTMDAVEKFLDREFQPGTGVSFFSLGANFKVLHKFTTDRKELMQAAASMFNGPLPVFGRVADAVVSSAPFTVTVSVNQSGAATVSLAGGEVNLRAITGADVGTSPGEAAYRALMADMARAFNDINGMQAWDQMKLMLSELAPLPGRKTILLLSTGLATDGDPDLFQKLLDWANKGQITVYAVDVNGLQQNSNVLASNSRLDQAAGLSRGQAAPIPIGLSAGASMNNARQGDIVNMAVRTTDPQAPLRALAEGTGGFLIANTDDMRKPFQRLVEDVDTHYEAVYRPASDNYDGRLRSIEVKLARKDLNVQHRTGYFALPATPGATNLTLPDVVSLAALNASTQPHAFEFQSAVRQVKGQAALLIALPAGGLAATPIPGQSKVRLRPFVLTLIKDAGGQVVDKYSQAASFDVPNEAFEQACRTPIPFAHVFDLPPGRYTAETVIVDLEASRASVGTVAFTIVGP